MSDNEMLKLDGALAAAFRSMRRANKNSPEQLEKRKQIKHFKLRSGAFTRFYGQPDLLSVVIASSERILLTAQNNMLAIVQLLTFLRVNKGWLALYIGWI